MYYFIYGFLYLLSLLPLRILFIGSDLFYILLYYVAGYRKKVVFNNLSIAFPYKTKEEKIRIAKGFYKNFSDSFFETIKMISSGKHYIKKHFIGDYSIFERMYESGKKCQVHLGHNFNWELANLAFASSAKQPFIVVYMPIENKLFERLFKKIRSKTGAILLPATHLRSAIIPWRHMPYVLALVADQNPAVPANAYWVNFFGRPTPFLRGPESGSKATDTEIVFCHFTKTKRGCYEAHFKLCEDDFSTMGKGQLTSHYALYLEKVISANPEMWLWSHRRWKFDWNKDFGPVIES